MDPGAREKQANRRLTHHSAPAMFPAELLHDLWHVGFGDPQASRLPLITAYETIEPLACEVSTGGLFDQFIRRFTLSARTLLNCRYEIIGECYVFRHSGPFFKGTTAER